MNVPSPQQQGELIPTRQSLLERLKDLDDSKSWREFFELYRRLLHSVALKSGLSEVEAQEVVQETLIAVSRHIEQFQYDPKRGSFKNWLLKMTRWRIVDQLRKRNQHQKTYEKRAQARAEETRRTSTLDRMPDPKADNLDVIWEEEWRKNTMEFAMKRVRTRVDPTHYQIFSFYALKHLPVARICEMFDVPAGRVYVIKNRITALIKKEVQVLEKEASAKK